MIDYAQLKEPNPRAGLKPARIGPAMATLNYRGDPGAVTGSTK
jgi:hypothetical protein